MTTHENLRPSSRVVLARDAAWTLADGDCKELTGRWSRWEKQYLAAGEFTERALILLAPAAVCEACPITSECADLAELSRYTGIAAGRGYRNGSLDTYGSRDHHSSSRKRTA